MRACIISIIWLTLIFIPRNNGFIPCFRKYLNPGKCMGNIIYHPMSSPYICCKKFPTGGYSFKLEYDEKKKNKYTCYACIYLQELLKNIELKRNAKDTKTLPWGEWSSCSRTCQAGVQIRYRQDCEISRNGPILQCQQIRNCQLNLYCPLNGEWGDWSRWTKCMPKCKDNIIATRVQPTKVYTKSRRRFCDSPKPMHHGTNCTGLSREIKRCTPCNERSVWGKWRKWTNCNDSKCGIKTIKKRTRICIRGSKKRRMCKGRSIKRKRCKIIKCPVDGQWSLFGNWSKCRLKKDNCKLKRYSIRKRKCNSPKAQFKGNKCIGKRREKRECHFYEKCY